LDFANHHVSFHLAHHHLIWWKTLCSKSYHIGFNPLHQINFSFFEAINDFIVKSKQSFFDQTLKWRHELFKADVFSFSLEKDQ
tara:strand:- start:1327 stop:1575 length:249 start_codon:yes stop_codon:yes gene_type:complete